MFHSTQPGEAGSSSGLMRVSEFHRHVPPITDQGEFDAGATKLAALNPSLLQDLLRFGPALGAAPGADDRSSGLDLLEVLAASLRHGRALLLHLQLDYRVIPLAVLPSARQVQCPLGLAQLLGLRLPELRVLRVEPARPPEPDAPPPQPLGTLLWELCLRGARGSLLPEIAGVATYRIAPGADLSQVDLSGSLSNAVARLRLQTTPLREIATWPGFDRDRAMRLLNALYLQSALIISRSHPGAVDGL